MSYQRDVSIKVYMSPQCPQDYHVMFIIIVVHVNRNWVALLVFPSLRILHNALCFWERQSSGRMLSIRANSVLQALGLIGWSIKQQGLTFNICEASKSKRNSLQCWGVSWTSVTNNSKQGLSCLVFGDFISLQLLGYGKPLSNQKRKFHLSYIFTY